MLLLHTFGIKERVKRTDVLQNKVDKNEICYVPLHRHGTVGHEAWTLLLLRQECLDVQYSVLDKDVPRTALVHHKFIILGKPKKRTFKED